MWQETGKLFQNCFSKLPFQFSWSIMERQPQVLVFSKSTFYTRLKVTIQWALTSGFIPFCWGNISSTSLLWGCGCGRKVATWPFSHWSHPPQQDRMGRQNWPMETSGSVPSKVRVSVFRLCQTPWPRPRVLRQIYPFQLKASKLGSKIINFVG